MAQLDQRLLRSEERTIESRVIGTYLQPGVWFGERSDIDLTPGHLAEVVRTVKLDGHDVLVTRMGGVFVRPPKDIQPFWLTSDSDPGAQFTEKQEFQRKFAEAVNLLIAELSMAGSMPLDPVTGTGMGSGETFGRQAVVVGGGGVAGRMSGLTSTLVSGRQDISFKMLNNVEPATLDALSAVSRATALRAIGSTLPTFVAAAFAFLRDDQYAEGLIDAWIVIEQVVNSLWDRLLGGAAPSAASKELRKERSMTRKVNLLEVFGKWDPDLAQAVRSAATLRNGLVHGSKVSAEAANKVHEAMVQVIRHVLPGVEIEYGAWRSVGSVSW